MGIILSFMVKPIIQILVLSYFFYFFYTALSANKALPMLRPAVIYIFVYFFAMFAKLDVLYMVMKKMIVPSVVFLCILYQPELRRSFTGGFSTRKKLFGNSGQTKNEEIDEVLAACRHFVESKRGALIVFPRKVQLRAVLETGTKINSDISSALIISIFDHDTPLHDGAMIIQNSRIVAAGCYLPLSAQTDISASFGTRHRAAIGMSEESDAVIVVVSEETGAKSLAYGGNIYYALEDDVIKSTLISLLNNLELTPQKNQESANE